jgi:hypothetical protein
LLVQERVEVWEAPRVMLEGVRVHVSPAGDTELVRVTVPVNPLTGATVIVEVAAVPTLTLAVVGLAVTVKVATATLNVTVAVWDRDPVAPVTVTTKLPLTVAVHERVEVPDPVTLVGVRVQVIPVAGLLADVRETTPANPLTAVTVIVEVPAWLMLTGTLVGLATIVKSWIV